MAGSERLHMAASWLIERGMVNQGWRITSTWIGVAVALFAAPAVVFLVRNAYGSAQPVRITESPVGAVLG